jgi:transposase
MQDQEHVVDIIRNKYAALKDRFDERSRRIWSAAEANALGHGGVGLVAKATGIARSTIRIGRRELEATDRRSDDSDRSRIRRQGGGRKQLSEKQKGLIESLDQMVEPTSRGDPMSPLRWTCKSTRKLAEQLGLEGIQISHTKVGQLLSDLGYSLQSTRKRFEGNSHPDRNAQFEYISSQVETFQSRGHPVISVDTKKKELIGNFVNAGREYQPKGTPEEVEAYDFTRLGLGKGIPYGVYDMTSNEGWMSVGMSHDTAQFAVETIRQWWIRMGSIAYPHAKELLITADGGGSNGVRCRLWKIELQKLSNETDLKVSVCHFPPGTSKWNKIEHRMFSHITENWRGRPLLTYEVVVNLIANTRTKSGLKIKAELDANDYPTGIKVSDREIADLNIQRHEFHGADWNYTIKPSG